MMETSDLKGYCKAAFEKGASHVRVIPTESIVTAPWVRLKCQFGCARYSSGYCCPPDTPNAEQTKTFLDSYGRAILFHLKSPKTRDRSDRIKNFFSFLVHLEGEVFKDGFYKAFVFLAGPCRLCDECGKLSGKPCLFPDKARPSMEACGIDVYQTVRKNGLFIEPLREITQTSNNYCLMLVD